MGVLVKEGVLVGEGGRLFDELLGGREDVVGERVGC